MRRSHDDGSGEADEPEPPFTFAKVVECNEITPQGADAFVLSNGKGFYSTLAYTLECRRLGIGFLSPDVNASRWSFVPENGSIRVPVRVVQDLTTATLKRYRRERERGPFASLNDFHDRVNPGAAETLNLIRVGAFDGFGQPRTAQFWQLQHLAQWPHNQGFFFKSEEHSPLPAIPLTEPDYAQRLRDEMELLGFTVSGQPLDMFAGIAWTPIARSATLPATPTSASRPAVSSSPTARIIKSPATR